MNDRDKAHPEPLDANRVIIVLSTCPEAEGARIAEALVNEHLAACVNRLPGATSTYIWQGQVHSDSEMLLVIKSTERRFAALQTRLAALHPYELPEIVAIPVCAGAENYLAWVRDTVKSK